MLIDEAVIGRHKNVGKVGGCELADQFGQIFDSDLCSLCHAFLGGELVANDVDPVVIDVEIVMIAENLFSVVRLQAHEIIGLHGFDTV